MPKETSEKTIGDLFFLNYLFILVMPSTGTTPFVHFCSTVATPDANIPYLLAHKCTCSYKMWNIVKDAKSPQELKCECMMRLFFFFFWEMFNVWVCVIDYSFRPLHLWFLKVWGKRNHSNGSLWHTSDTNSSIWNHKVFPTWSVLKSITEEMSCAFICWIGEQQCSRKAKYAWRSF